MLVLKVEYLTGVCMATKHNDPTRSMPEWPPHPDRLYSALVAAAAEAQPAGGTDLPDPAKAALDWLAEQCWDDHGQCKAPLLHASRAHGRATPAVPMPTNPHEDEVWKKPRKNRPREPQSTFDLKTLLPIYRKKALLPIPAVVPEEPTVYFIWPDTEANEHLEILRSICERVTYLGRSRSLVRVTIEDRAPRAAYVPDPDGDVELRVPGKGRLSYLIEKYKRDGGKPEPSPPRRYRAVAGASGPAQTATSIFGRFWIWQPQRDDPPLPATATLKVTRAFRRALLEQLHRIACGCDRWKSGVPPWEEAQACYAKIPGQLSGHAPNGAPLEAPHLAFVSLPFVHPQQRHADGAIKGLGVLTPRDVDHDALRMLAQALSAIEERELRIPGIGVWHLREVPADDPPLTTLDSHTWSAASRTWASATPVAFGYFPKPKKGGEAKVVLDSLWLIGIDPSSVVQIAVGQHSALHGSPPSWCFTAHRGRPAEPQRLMRHITIEFNRPVEGPLVLGCLRYFGLGLMRPLEG